MNVSGREREIVEVQRQTCTPAEKPPISTHVLDTSKGIPASGIPIGLFKGHNDAWFLLKRSETDGNGRCGDLANRSNFEAGRYMLRFEVEKYFAAQNVSTMFPVVEIIFDIKSTAEHYHVPLLLSPFGFTTYRGS